MKKIGKLGLAESGEKSKKNSISFIFGANKGAKITKNKLMFLMGISQSDSNWREQFFDVF